MAITKALGKIAKKVNPVSKLDAAPGSARDAWDYLKEDSIGDKIRLKDVANAHNQLEIMAQNGASDKQMGIVAQQLASKSAHSDSGLYQHVAKNSGDDIERRWIKTLKDRQKRVSGGGTAFQKAMTGADNATTAKVAQMKKDMPVHMANQKAWARDTRPDIDDGGAAETAAARQARRPPLSLEERMQKELKQQQKKTGVKLEQQGTGKAMSDEELTKSTEAQAWDADNARRALEEKRKMIAEKYDGGGVMNKVKRMKADRALDKQSKAIDQMEFDEWAKQDKNFDPTKEDGGLNKAQQYMQHRMYDEAGDSFSKFQEYNSKLKKGGMGQDEVDNLTKKRDELLKQNGGKASLAGFRQNAMDQINKKGGRPDVSDYVYGYHMPEYVVGGSILAGGAATIMSSAQGNLSNAQLYSQQQA